VKNWKGPAFDDDELPDSAPKSRSKKSQARIKFIHKVLFEDMPTDEHPPLYFCGDEPVTPEHPKYDEVVTLHRENESNQEDHVTRQNEDVAAVLGDDEDLKAAIGETMRAKGGLAWFGTLSAEKCSRVIIASIKDPEKVAALKEGVEIMCKVLCESVASQTAMQEAFAEALEAIGCRWCGYSDTDYRTGFSKWIAAESFRAEIEYMEKKGRFIRRA
jgi:hypothetical protein